VTASKINMSGVQRFVQCIKSSMHSRQRLVLQHQCCQLLFHSGRVSSQLHMLCSQGLVFSLERFVFCGQLSVLRIPEVVLLLKSAIGSGQLAVLRNKCSMLRLETAVLRSKRYALQSTTRAVSSQTQPPLPPGHAATSTLGAVSPAPCDRLTKLDEPP